jgi:Activator of Hsp90 ATPase homolog 1-like protein
MKRPRRQARRIALRPRAGACGVAHARSPATAHASREEGRRGPHEQDVRQEQREATKAAVETGLRQWQYVDATRVSRHINAPRERVYNALIDPKAIVKWKVPFGMTSHVHEFEGREGGTFRISLSYDTPKAPFRPE